MGFFSTAVGCLLLAGGAPAQDGVKKISMHDALTAVVTKAPPDYPAVARQLKISGTVEVEAVIGENGAVDHVKPLNGSPVLTKAASDALLKWKFKPFSENGKPMKVAADFSFTFNP